MVRRSLALLLLLAPAACGAAGDPYAREATWHALGDNDANLRAMLVDEHDLVQGRGATTSLGAEAGPPVRLLLSGNRAPLPALSASGVAASTAQPAQPQGAPQSGGGNNGQNQ